MEDTGFGIEAVRSLIQGGCLGLVLGALTLSMYALIAPCINHRLSLQLEIAIVNYTIWRALGRVDGLVDWWLIINVSECASGRGVGYLINRNGKHWNLQLGPSFNTAATFRATSQID